MNVITFLITHPKSSVLMKPRLASFDYPAIYAKPTSIITPAFSKQRKDSPLTKLLPMRLTIVGPVTQSYIRSLKWSANFSCNWRDTIHQRYQLCHIMSICTGKLYRKRDTIGIGYQMVFRAFFAAIRWIWACFCPPKTALTEVESTIEREKSMMSACRRLSNKVLWILSHIPACCQSFSLRQQVIPEPHPNSCGKSSQPIPVFSTKRMPFKTALSDRRFRPGYRNLLLFFGINGSMIFHNLSSSICLAMSSILAFIRNLIYSCYRSKSLIIFHFVRGS